MFSDFYGQDDPLGLAVKGRARERRIAASLQGLQPIGGPLPDPNWDAYFQAADEAAGGMPVKFAGGDYGTNPNSNQLQGRPVLPALQGLRSAVKPKRRVI